MDKAYYSGNYLETKKVPTWTNKRPEFPNKLFYKGFFKLRENDELAFHYYRWDHGTFILIVAYAQFIRIYLSLTDIDNHWVIQVRDEDGTLEKIYLSGWGAVPTHNEAKKGYESKWIANSWIALRENEIKGSTYLPNLPIFDN